MARRSKYKFATLNVHDTIIVDGIDVYSIKNSLAGYNKRNGTSLVIENTGESESGKYIFERVA